LRQGAVSMVNRSGPPLLSIEDVVVRFDVKRGFFDRLSGQPQRAVHALNGVRLDIAKGETLGVVGESGCGKSTLARTIVGLIEANDGRVTFQGRDIAMLKGVARRAYNRRVQMVFQDPYGSLNPQMSVRQMLGEALSVHRMRSKAEIPGRIAELLDLVRLPSDSAEKRPHEFSGGQRQRIGIARALAVEPEILVADELVSALDVSVQAQIVNLLLDLQQRFELTVIFVAHDLRLVRHISDRVAVMYLGEVVEIGEAEALFSAPRHPYTRALLDAAPDLDPTRRNRVPAAYGELPSPLSLPSGCRFHPRCRLAYDLCKTDHPVLLPHGMRQRAACHIEDIGRIGVEAMGNSQL
jgi:oligopeptide/dipeptide ABC transporter ATP-binding protein